MEHAGVLRQEGGEPSSSTRSWHTVPLAQCRAKGPVAARYSRWPWSRRSCGRICKGSVKQCTVKHCTVHYTLHAAHCTALHRTAHCTALHRTTHCTALHRTCTLYCTAHENLSLRNPVFVPLVQCTNEALVVHYLAGGALHRHRRQHGSLLDEEGAPGRAVWSRRAGRWGGFSADSASLLTSPSGGEKCSVHMLQPVIIILINLVSGITVYWSDS